MLRHDTEGGTEFVTVSLWEAEDAIRAFAGHDIETAVYYPEDERFLIEKEPKVAHFAVADQIPQPA